MIGGVSLFRAGSITKTNRSNSFEQNGVREYRRIISTNGITNDNRCPFGVYFSSTKPQLSDFTVTGVDINYSDTATGIRCVGAGTKTSGAFGNYITLNGHYVQSENWTLEMTATINSAPVAGGGDLAMNLDGPGSSWGFIHALVLQTGASFGKTVMYNWQTHSQLAISTGTTISNGDVIKMTMTKSVWTYTLTTLNITSGVSRTLTVTPNQTTDFLNNTGQFSINPLIAGATAVDDYTINSYKFTINENINKNFMLVSDSIGVGTMLATPSQRYINLFCNNNEIDTTVYAGGSDTLIGMLNSLPELLMYNPKYVLLSIGGNDYNSGVPFYQWSQNYITLTESLREQGAVPVHLLAPPLSSIDIRPFNNWRKQQYSNDIIIDNFTPLVNTPAGSAPNPIYFAADLQHPNAAGHVVIWNQIEAAIGYLRINNMRL